MFKIMSRSEYNSLVNRINAAAEEIKVAIAERDEKIKSLTKNQTTLINDYNQAKASSEACKTMRDDLRNKLIIADGKVEMAQKTIEELREKNRLVAKSLTETVNQLEALKADMAKQGNELVVKSDDEKQLKRSIENLKADNKALIKNIEEAKNMYSNAQSRACNTALLNASLLEGITAAMAEMRKVNRGKPSHNKSRAFQHLEKAMAAYNATQPKTNEA